MTQIRMNTRTLSLAILAASGCLAQVARANPDGGDVVQGSAEFIFGEDYLRILTGDLTIIDWLSFNIDAGYTVEFLMPGVDSRVLNRITSGVPTEIMGNLLANGQVFIANPSGVIFGQGSVVNVGALYAAAGNISNADFVSGVHRFTDARGIVENRGHLQGDFIALIGGRVANHGRISAPNGTVVMAAGEQVLIGEHLGRVFVQIDVPTTDADLLGSSGNAGLDLAAGDVFSLAAWNTGTIESGSVAVHGGGGRTVVSGEIVARNGDQGGDISLLGHTVELRGAVVDASGMNGGGSVVIGGNPHADTGSDRSAYVDIDDGSVVRADAISAGDGGSVVIWSDVFTNIDGAVSARGGAVAGNGGFIETSGLRGLRISRMVDASAVNGRGGHWLIDPTNIIIAPGSLGSLGGWGPSDTAVVGVNLINQALNAGMDVTLTTFNPLGNGSGEIVQMESAPFILNSGSATLSLYATGSILLHGGAYATNGSSLSLVLVAGDPGQPAPADPFSNGRIEINEVLSLGGGSLTAIGNSVLVRSRNISDTGDVLVRAGDIQLIARDRGAITLGADLTSTAAGILLDGETTLVNDVTLTLEGGSWIEATGAIRSADGMYHDLTVRADGGVVTLNQGVGDSGDGRIGLLDVTADLVRVGGDVRVTEGMNFYSPVSVFGESVVFHTELGTALFADNIYSEVYGGSDVSFEYDGQAWAGTGQGRTPFKFRGSIGVGGLADGPTLGDGVGGAFRNIRFGGDLVGSPSVATYLFANAAVAGLDLTSLSLTDLSSIFQIVATESIRTGRGQKITSFGSLALTAEGAGSTLIEVGDLTVVGDLSLRSLGSEGTVRLLGRVAGNVDGQNNEGDRDATGTADERAELIAMGSITIEGSISADSNGLAMGYNGVILANESGAGMAGGLPIEVIEGGAGIDRFSGIFKGTGDMLYAYDLAAFASGPGPSSRANLAEAFADEGPIRVRSDERLLASEQVLRGLNFATRTIPEVSEPDAGSGPRSIVRDASAITTPGDGASLLTMDRLSRKSVRRLTRSYVELLGDRLTSESPERSETPRVRREIGTLWVAWNEAGSPEDIARFADNLDPGLGRTLWQVTQTVFAIDLLELTPAEIRHARATLFQMILPETVPMEELEDAWFPSASSDLALSVR